MKELKIGIMGGLGHIGLIQAACLAKLEYKTTAYDIDTEKVMNVLNGDIPFEEEGLSELVKETIGKGNLSLTSRIDDLADADIIFICVGTPSLVSGEPDISQIYSAVDSLIMIRKKHCIVVIKSTVPVGTSRKLTQYLEEKDLLDIVTFVSNPEFLKEGTGVKDFWSPSRIIIGCENRTVGEKVAELYSPKGVPILFTNWENAELIKLVSNAFLSTKISFINEISILSERVGADIRVISKGIGLDPRISPYFIEAGVGFSGPCLEKDLKSLIDQFHKVQKKAVILEAVFEVNEGQRESLIEKLEKELGELEGRRIGVFGLAFKEKTDDVRQSHSLPIVKKLLEKGAIVTVTDPFVKNPRIGGLDENELPGVIWKDSPYEAAKNQEGILILTAWKEYKELDLLKIKEAMKNPLIIDGKNLFDIEDMKNQNITYLGVGI